MHDNLLGFFDTRREAYASLLKHQKRDQARVAWVFGLICVVLIAYSESWISEAYGFRVAVGVGALLVYGFNLIIDSSNREFALHVMDWMEDIESKRVQPDR